MSDQSMRPLLERLAAAGELLRFTAPVDPQTQMSALLWKAYDERGQGSLVENITGHPGWRAAGQVLADRRKWAMGFGQEPDDLLPWLAERAKHPVAPQVTAGPALAQEVVHMGEKVDITAIPAMITSELDLSPYISSGLAIVKDPETGIRNVSMHRMQVDGPRQLAFYMVQRHAWHVYEKYNRLGKPMPVAVAIGVHPAIAFASAYTGPFGLDELAVAGGILGEPVRMVKAKTVDLEVPADAEIILEGEILPGLQEPEGPYGEVTGLYAARTEANIFRITAMTRRADPIFHAICSGVPVTESQTMTGLPMETVIFDRVRTTEGLIKLHDVRVLAEAGNLTVVVKMTPTFEGQARNVLMAALSSPYLHPKIAIAVDDDVDIYDPRQILWSMSTRVNPARDTFVMDNVRTFPLDWSGGELLKEGGRMQRLGSKMGIDATRPSTMLPELREKYTRALPKGHETVDVERFL